MSNLEATLEAVKGTTDAVTIHLDGVLDQPTLASFQAQLEQARKDGKLFVILDMRGVSYANSTTLGALVTQADAFRDAGGELVLLKPQPKVDLVIDMLGLSTLFKVFRSEKDAEDHMRAASSGEAPAGAGAGGEQPAAAAQEPREPASAPASGEFPVRGECLGCGIVLEFSQHGHFRCPRCHAVYQVEQGGRVKGQRPKGSRPIEVTFPCRPEAMKAFQRLVGTLPAWESYSDVDRIQLESAIGEVCEVIRKQAYGGDESGSVHALIVSREDALALRLADHGKVLDRAAFPLAAEFMTELEHRPHPGGGNVLRMTKRGA